MSERESDLGAKKMCCKAPRGTRSLERVHVEIATEFDRDDRDGVKEGDSCKYTRSKGLNLSFALSQIPAVHFSIKLSL